MNNRSIMSLVAVCVLASGPTAVAHAQSEDEKTYARAAIEARFAETPIDDVSCDGYGPLCQVTAGKTVFYVDPDARHAFIGRVYDLDAKRDLTEETLVVLRPADTASVDSVDYMAPIAWDALPFEHAIIRNKGGALKVAVFSDLNCGYCRRLSDALAGAPDIEVHEFLVGFGQSADVSNAVACADDPEAAIENYYQSRQVPAGVCDKDIVGPAQNAARQVGMQGTPTFIRPDGAMTAGFQDIQSLRAWLLADANSAGDFQ